MGGRQNLKVFIFSRKLILSEKEWFKAAREYCQCGDEEKTLRLLNLRFGRQGIIWSLLPYGHLKNVSPSGSSGSCYRL